MTPEERNELVDMVAQAVIDRIEQRSEINSMADIVVARVIQLQKEEAELQAQEQSQVESQPAAMPQGE